MLAARRVAISIALSAAVAGCGDVTLGARDAGEGGVPDAARTMGGAPDAARTDGGADAGPDCACPAGDGAYCEARAAEFGASSGCPVADAAADGTRLFDCAGGVWSAASTCADGCEVGEAGATDACALPACACFVRSAWCGASAARHGLTLEPPCRVPIADAHAEDILACDADGRWIVLEACDAGCVERPTGTPDACVSTRTPADPGWATCAHRSLLASGLHPEASDRLRCAGVSADRISQTIGSAPASAGYHAADGTVDGAPYTAAVDLRTRDLSETEIRALLERLAANGFAAWYRKPGSDGWPSSEAPHIHAVFAGVVMKSQLRGQVRDFLVGLNGLASHTTYRFWRPSAPSLEIVRLLFSRHYTP